jgi:hypothetical protein
MNVSLNAQDSLVEHYLVSAGQRSPLYTGKEPLPYPRHITNHPYLGTALFAEGTVVYDDVRYPGVYMRLDRFRDELTVLLPNEQSEFSLILQPERVNYVDLHGYRIIYFRPDGLKGCPKQGYYQQLYDGECRVMEYTSCSMFETRKEEVMTGNFNFSTKYYIRKDNAYYQVRSKGSVLKVFRTHKNELNRFVREQKLNFKQQPEEAIVAVVKEYETLIRKP